MKKILLTFLFVCSAILVIAQGNITTTISGYVINSTTGLPVSSQEVYIMADSSSSTFSYYNVVYTNPNGYYTDTLSIPSPSQIIFYISTSNCNGAMITNTVISNILPMTSDFTINCDGTPVSCSADFSVYPDSMNTLGYTYYFYDQSSGTGITSWAWDFGDGGTSALQYPSYTYASTGMYNVCLTITGDSCTDTFCNTIYVDSTNTPTCNASFQYSVNSMDVDFYGYANSSNATYAWDFGDGSVGTGQNINYTYMSSGSYTVCLTIATSNGCTDTYCETITLDGSSDGCPSSFYAYPDSSSLYTYYFYNSSPGANSSGINFLWSFGDGTGSSDVNPVHTFTGSGTYTVCLSVLDDSTGVTLCTYCNSVVVDTSNSTGCYAYFGWNTSGTGSVYFYDYSGTGNSSDNIISWTWSFGDGTSSTDQNPVHYFGSGLFYVCLATTSSSGCSATYCDYVQVNYIDSSNYCNLYVSANTIIYESTPGAADGAIDIDVYGGTPPYSFSWSNGTSTEDISGLTAGYYDLVVTDNSGLLGCQTWATFEILNMSDSSNWGYVDTLNTLPVDSCFNFSIGTAYIYSYTFIDNYTIEITWIIYDTEGVSHGFVTTVYTFDSSGSYLFTVTITCGSFKGTHVFFDDLYIMSPSGLTDMQSSQENISLYPNPATDLLNIAFPKTSEGVTVNISNAAGQIMHTINYDRTDGSALTVNTSLLPQGIYFVQVISNGQTISGRFIK